MYASQSFSSFVLFARRSSFNSATSSQSQFGIMGGQTNSLLLPACCSWQVYADNLYAGEKTTNSRWSRPCFRRPSYWLFSASEIRKRSNGIDG